MPRSTKGTSKASATGIAKSAKGQAMAQERSKKRRATAVKRAKAYVAKKKSKKGSS
jgi:hypothetical protein